MRKAAGNLIWLASYPKSGNTWFRLLLANFLSAGDEPVSINAISLPGGSVVNHADVGAETLLDTDLLTPEEADALRPHMVGALLEKAEECRYVKLHDAFRLGADGAPLLGLGRARGAVYLIRDPRDVAISLAHHNGSSIDAAIRLLNSPDGALADKPTRRFRQLPQVTGDWSGHVDGWMGQSSLPLHAIRYEDLLADTAGILSKALRFLDIEADPARIGRAVRFADFQELRRQERAEPFVEGWAKSSAPFFRSGRAGAWREVLSDAQSAAIEAAHGPVMRRFGYGV